MGPGHHHGPHITSLHWNSSLLSSACFSGVVLWATSVFSFLLTMRPCSMWLTNNYVKTSTLCFFVRKMVLICLKYNILFKAKHVPGIRNHLADSCLACRSKHFFKWHQPPWINHKQTSPITCSHRIYKYTFTPCQIQPVTIVHSYTQESAEAFLSIPF